MVSEFLTFFEWHSALRLEIAFVTNKDSRNVITCVLFDFSHPVLNCREWLTVCDIVSNNYTVGTFVIAWCNGLESLLASCVPNLKFDCLSINLIVTDLEVDTDCWHKVVCKDIILNKYIRYMCFKQFCPQGNFNIRLVYLQRTWREGKIYQLLSFQSEVPWKDSHYRNWLDLIYYVWTMSHLRCKFIA